MLGKGGYCIIEFSWEIKTWQPKKLGNQKRVGIVPSSEAGQSKNLANKKTGNQKTGQSKKGGYCIIECS